MRLVARERRATMAAGRRGALGTPPRGLARFRGPRQAVLSPKIGLTESGSASAHSEFSETKGGWFCLGMRAQGRGMGHEDGGRALDFEFGDHGQKL